MIFVFCASMAFIFYVVIGYSAALYGLWKLRGPRPVPHSGAALRVDFMIPAHNEAAVIVEKLQNTRALANPDGHVLRIVVVSDGSSDDTVALAQSIDDPRIDVIETPGRMGKLGAMNFALDRLQGDVVVFSDANAILSLHSLERMIPHFSDPDVGGVCGQIRVDTTKGGAIAKADDLYWRYDQAMKRAESDLGGVVSAQGSIYAIRRSLLGHIPEGPADDFYNSVRVVDQGYRLAFEPEATTREGVTEHTGDEISRRIRSTQMGWCGLMMMRHLMNPFRHGLYGWQLLSHKGLRRLTPVALIMAFVSNLALMDDGWVWLLLGLGQIVFYAIAVAGFYLPAVRKLPLAPKITFFAASNLAMLLGIIQHYRGRRIGIWTPVRDTP